MTGVNQEEKDRMLRWIVETCLLMGAKYHTAFQVAATFAEGLGW